MALVVSPDRLLSPKQTANRLDTTVGTLSGWRCNGRYDLPFVKIGSRVKYRAADVEAFIARRTRNTHTSKEQV